MVTIERFRGCLLGLAAGDALGTSLEFSSPGTYTPIQDMIGGGPFRLRAGQWTDDTSMALCLASSLVELGEFDLADQMQRYVSWYRHGYLSSTGSCFDIGGTVRKALMRFEATGDPLSGGTDEYSAGNGSIMRLGPVPMFFASRPRQAIERSAESSLSTHAVRAAVDSCRYLGALLVGALRGETKTRLLDPHYSPLEGYWTIEPLTESIDEIASGSFKRKSPPEILGSGYVVKSLEAALWAFWNGDDFRECSLLAANLGDDADTTAAVCGQLAGAYYGEKSIPVAWLDKLAMKEKIIAIADALFALATQG